MFAFAQNTLCLGNLPSSIRDSGDWAPSLKLDYSSHQLEKYLCYSSQKRSARLAERHSKKRLATTLVQPNSKKRLASDDIVAVNVSEKATQTSHNLESHVAADCELGVLEVKVYIQTELEMVSATLRESEVEVKRLKEEVETIVLDERSFVKKDDRVLYYTGLANCEILCTIFLHIQPSLMKQSVLSPFQQLLVVYMIGLNFACQDLACRFKVQCSTISHNFHSVLDILYIELKSLISWPDRDTQRRTMPMNFRQYCPSCVVIINYFEIFVQNYLPKHKHIKLTNTIIRYLIGITPLGTVSYLSDSWGGRVIIILPSI